MSIVNALALLAAAGGDYTISRSVRLRSSASAYFNRTPASNGNQKTFTISSWVKITQPSSAKNYIYTSGVSSYPSIANNYTILDMGSSGFSNSTNYLEFLSSVGGTTQFQLQSTAIYRDPSAWYHVVVAVDTTQATASNRIKMYVNGVQVTSFSAATYPSLNLDIPYFNNASYAQYIGQIYYYGSMDGYLTEYNFIDGQALTPSSFGENDTVTGVWKPKKYAGTYGTNGFYLNFSDNSNNTAATIGKDYSGNGNNWTPNNISVTSGSTYDSMLDVPTMWADGGNGRGNYAVMNPLDYVAAAFSGTASDGNLTVSIPAPGSSNGIASSIKVFSTAQTKFYIETTVTALTTFCSLGMISGTNANYRIRHTNDITINVNDVIMTAFDPATGNVWYGRNGTWLSSGNPSAGTNPWATMSAGEIVGSAFSVVATNGSTGTFTTKTTFGQQPFTYTPPSGFVALNTQNLPDSTIKKGNQYMDVRTWSGDGATPKAVVTDLGFQPDLIWAKARSNTYDHMLYDSVRGAGSTKDLSSNTTGAEGATGATYGYVSSIDSAGFTVTKGSAATNILNQSGQTFAAWNWKKGATQGFDIVTYTGNGATSSTRTISHSLGVTPAFIITKKRSGGTDYGWSCWHKDLGGNYGIWLDKTSARNASMWAGYSNFSSTVFTPPDLLYGNENGATYVNYLFSEVAGFSRMGSYQGNGSSDGSFVYLGFRPRWILFKDTTNAATNWVLQDTSRFTYNLTAGGLLANTSASEYSTGYDVDILSNGFKIRRSGGDTNQSGATIIYAAFAENPFKNALAR